MTGTDIFSILTSLGAAAGAAWGLSTAKSKLKRCSRNLGCGKKGACCDAGA